MQQRYGEMALGLFSWQVKHIWRGKKAEAVMLATITDDWGGAQNLKRGLRGFLAPQNGQWEVAV